jgi:hypothetical protein
MQVILMTKDKIKSKTGADIRNYKIRIERRKITIQRRVLKIRKNQMGTIVYEIRAGVPIAISTYKLPVGFCLNKIFGFLMKHSALYNNYVPSQFRRYPRGE